MEYIQIRMIRPDLRNVPACPLPEGFAIRMYRDGDADAWVRIWRQSDTYLKDISPALFQKEFGRDLPSMPRRCMFLVCPDGREIGTITAWRRASHGRPWGLLHWLAIVPEFQGRGLSRPMVAALLERLRALGHRRALLLTQTVRLAAIRTYLRFGFRPEVAGDEDRRAWSLVREVVSHPALDAALA
jgi:GNAT superfamily N-acetyltransferase